MERCSDLGIQGLREILVPDTNGVARPLCVSPEAELIALARSKGQVFDRPRSSAYSGCGARSSKRRIKEIQRFAEFAGGQKSPINDHRIEPLLEMRNP
jgi:hypothetical protein